ncbi:aspartate/glutamate racemase family protein [Halanaerobium sp. Z-7514]|uniref:Aspartate/glutamate racemase family protein n=1 Tax=Halanaerobium polyolivorans TaxID=2886943 RepID=A0AAW4X0J4_9FIRM|nr:aspartate/glutamate racemase family protein [Halanaerobium polyolivorans]MCC3145315.1 aspartate/glutamate racemase family protein [Halanaerobium polyolivorans]
MLQKTIAVIRVVTLDNAMDRNKHALILKRHYPQFNFVTFTIPDQPEGVHDFKSHQKSIPKIIKLVEQIKDVVDAVLISCAADPAVTELEQLLDIPVCGTGASSAHYARSLADQIAVVGMGEFKIKEIIEVLGDNLIDYQLLNNIKTTQQLNTPKGKIELINAVKNIHKQASAVILACTGMSTMEIADHLAKSFELPVIDPLVTGALFLKKELRAAEAKELREEKI